MIITVTLNPAVDKTLMIPRFAVNEVNRVKETVMDPGGKGINVSKSVHALGGDTLCMGILGGETGTYIQKALYAMGLRQNMVMTGIPTRTNIKIVDLDLGTNTDINEPGAPVSAETLEALWNKLCAVAKPGDIVVFAGKNPPGTPDDTLAKWTRSLTEKGVSVFLDTVGEPMLLAMKEKPALIKPNREELEQLVGKELPTEEEILLAARQLNAQGIKLVAVSLGGDGAMLVTDEKALRVYVPKVSVVSTVGAGDSMMAALAYAAEKRYSLEGAARFAAAVSAATVQVEGSKPAPLDLIEPLIDKIIIKEL